MLITGCCLLPPVLLEPAAWHATPDPVAASVLPTILPAAVLPAEPRVHRRGRHARRRRATLRGAQVEAG